MSPDPDKTDSDKFDQLLTEEPEKHDAQIKQLQDALARERDGRKEDRFIGIIILVILLDVVLFSVLPSFGGPLAIFILELFILLPVARRMGMHEIATMLDRVLSRIAGKRDDGE